MGGALLAAMGVAGARTCTDRQTQQFGRLARQKIMTGSPVSSGFLAVMVACSGWPRSHRDAGADRLLAVAFLCSAAGDGVDGAGAAGSGAGAERQERQRGIGAPPGRARALESRRVVLRRALGHGEESSARRPASSAEWGPDPWREESRYEQEDADQGPRARAGAADDGGPEPDHAEDAADQQPELPQPGGVVTAVIGPLGRIWRVSQARTRCASPRRRPAASGPASGGRSSRGRARRSPSA